MKNLDHQDRTRRGALSRGRLAVFCREATTDPGSRKNLTHANPRECKGRMAAKPGDAFTLTELLVVLAVIAILTATLLPAFAMGGKGDSKLAQCLSNLRQIGAGCAMYADDFNGWYPITSVGAANNYESGSVNHLMGIHYTRYVYTPAPADPGIVMPQTLQPDQDQNLGTLYADSLLGDGHAMFCPGFNSVNTNSSSYPLSANYYSIPQFPATAGAPGVATIRSDYMFNPRIRNAAGYPNSSDILRKYQKTSDVKSRDVFTIDYLMQAGSLGVPFTPDNWAHWPGKGLNVLFTDGSAGFCAFNSLYFNAIVKNLTSGETQSAAVQYDEIFNALRDAP